MQQALQRYLNEQYTKKLGSLRPQHLLTFLLKNIPSSPVIAVSIGKKLPECLRIWGFTLLLGSFTFSTVLKLSSRIYIVCMEPPLKKSSNSVWSLTKTLIEHSPTLSAILWRISWHAVSIYHSIIVSYLIFYKIYSLASALFGSSTN